MPFLPSAGGWEILIILVIILLLFGAKRIPELAKGLGSGVREFKRGTRGEEGDKVAGEEKKGEELTAGTGETEKGSTPAQGETTHAEGSSERVDERSGERTVRTERHL